jgi:hypothetical protein
MHYSSTILHLGTERSEWSNSCPSCYPLARRLDEPQKGQFKYHRYTNRATTTEYNYGNTTLNCKLLQPKFLRSSINT